MALGAQCAEDGPFFATTPRSVIQNGMAISQDILIMPDWLLIGLMMASLLLLMIILVIGLVSHHICVQRCLYKNDVVLLNSCMKSGSIRRTHYNYAGVKIISYGLTNDSLERKCDCVVFLWQSSDRNLDLYSLTHEITCLVNIPKAWLEEDGVYLPQVPKTQHSIQLRWLFLQRICCSPI